MSVCHPCKAVAIIFRLLLYPLRVSLGAHYIKYGEAMRNAKNLFSILQGPHKAQHPTNGRPSEVRRPSVRSP